jgi:hypothetical protein
MRRDVRVEVERADTLPGGRSALVLERPGGIKLMVRRSEVSGTAAGELEALLQQRFDAGSLRQAPPAA